MKTEENFNVVKNYIERIIKSYEAVIEKDRYGLYKNDDAWQLAIKYIRKSKVKFLGIPHKKVLEILELFLEEALKK